MTVDMQEAVRLARECAMCRGAGVVWAPARAFPTGFKLFVGSACPRTEDRQHIEIVCPTCSGIGLETTAAGEA